MTPAGPALPILEGAVDCAAVVIGAGYTGLSAALHLRQAGIGVAVLEAAEPGWGASGRNNGQVIPTLSRPDPDDIVARHGEAGERFVALLGDSASLRAVALSIALGRELARAVEGAPERELALPFTDPKPLPAHALLHRLAPLMLAVYRRRDTRELR